MKKNIAVAFTCLILLCSSCKDFLETVPSDTLSPVNYYKTEADLLRALTGIYDRLQDANLYRYGLQTYLSFSDEFFYKSVSSGARVNEISGADVDINRFWSALYQGIERANLLLENIDNADIPLEKRDVLRGEALFLRGYYYFLLVDHFGGIPLKLTSTKSPIEPLLPRSSISDVYNQVVDDMKKAEQFVQPISAYGHSGRVSKTAVQGILAKVFLTMAGKPLGDISKYNDALEYTTKVISSGAHSLNPDYKRIFINQSMDLYDTKECIWEVEFHGNNTVVSSQEGGQMGIYNGIQNTVDLNIGYSTGNIASLGKMYRAYAAGDIRRDWNIAPFRYVTTAGVTDTLYWTAAQIYDRCIGKWRRKYETLTPKSRTFNSTNYAILRYSDVLLMHAEAEFRVNGATAAAYEALNKVRRRGYGVEPNTAISSISVVSNLILSTTGNTGYDPLVTNIPVTITGGGGTGATAVATVGTTGKVTAVNILTPGSGYISVPTVVVGTAWRANTPYTVGQQISNGDNLYTVTTAGTSTATAPVNTSGVSAIATTGAAFTYRGKRAIVTATIATTPIDLTSINTPNFFAALQNERFCEFAFEGHRSHDLKRWDIYIATMQDLVRIVAEDLPAGLSYASTTGRNFSERNRLFPIPTVETSVNPNITIANQNPGW